MSLNSLDGSLTTGSGDAGFSRPRTRYCYAKLVAPRTAPEIFQTYFYLPNGTEVPFETVLAWKNFKAEPYVEIEDVFVSKAVRSLQLKLRECVVTPAPERAQTRFSVAFPDRVCRQIDEAAAASDGDTTVVANAPAAPPPLTVAPCSPSPEHAAKRQRLMPGVEGDHRDPDPEVAMPPASSTVQLSPYHADAADAVGVPMPPADDGTSPPTAEEESDDAEEDGDFVAPP